LNGVQKGAGIMADGSVTTSDAITSNARVRGLVRALLAKRDFKGLLEDTSSLYDAGLTSLDLVNLMLAVEAEFDLEIPQEEMTPDNFRSVEAIERLVETLATAA
jgi:acyl carrier protein